MKCHYVNDGGKQVLIPGCMQGAHSDDIGDCTCTVHNQPKDEAMTKNEAQEALGKYINRHSKNSRFVPPIHDAIVLDTRDDKGNHTAWTWRGLLKIAYDLND